eukprot:COSAG06_NODE_18715_length_872_cov_0.905563_2_plen_107_part_00
MPQPRNNGQPAVMHRTTEDNPNTRARLEYYGRGALLDCLAALAPWFRRPNACHWSVVPPEACPASFERASGEQYIQRQRFLICMLVERSALCIPVDRWLLRRKPVR